MKLSTFDAFKHAGQNSETIEVSGSNLLALQRVLKVVLADVVAACEQCGARYTLSGGTCLGAVRHKGFIPWDDDLDLNILHGDFEKLQNALERMFPGKYSFQVPGVTLAYDLAFPSTSLLRNAACMLMFSILRMHLAMHSRGACTVWFPWPWDSFILVGVLRLTRISTRLSLVMTRMR